MKLKVGELHFAYNTLAEVVRKKDAIPSKAAYWIARMLKRLEPEYLPAEESRVALIKELGEEKDAGFVVDSKLSEFLVKWKEIVEVEVEIDPLMVKIDTLEGVNMTAEQMLALDKFVQD